MLGFHRVEPLVGGLGQCFKVSAIIREAGQPVAERQAMFLLAETDGLAAQGGQDGGDVLLDDFLFGYVVDGDELVAAEATDDVRLAA